MEPKLSTGHLLSILFPMTAESFVVTQPGKVVISKD